MPPKVKIIASYGLGLVLGLGGWVLSAAPGFASADMFEITVTTHPSVQVRLKEPFRIMYQLETRRTLGSDTKARVYLVKK